MLLTFFAWTSATLRRFFIGSPLGTRGWGGGSQSGERVDEEATLSISTAWACINLLAGLVGSMTIAPYRRDPSGHLVLAVDHWSYRLLAESPNDEQTPLDFWEGAAASIEMKGNAIADLDRAPDGRVLSLTPVPWTAVTVTREDGALVYRWGAERRTADQVLHIRGFGGAAEGGLSTLSYARNALGLHRAMERSASNMHANGLRPSGTLSLPGWIDEPKRSFYEDTLQTKFSGAMNAGKPMILEGGVKWEALAINPEDAEMLESRKLSIEEICRFFGVPPFMIGHTEKTTSWGTGLREQVQAFLKFAFRRRLKRIEQALGKQLLSAADRAAGIVFRFDLTELLDLDDVAKSEYFKTALGDTQRPGWMVRNEVRRALNLAPIAGWDEPVPLVTHPVPTAVK